jgi:hypothetical protein
LADGLGSMFAVCLFFVLNRAELSGLGSAS